MRSSTHHSLPLQLLIGVMIAFCIFTESKGVPQVYVYQKDAGTRAIGANVTVITAITGLTNGDTFIFAVRHANNETVYKIAVFAFYEGYGIRFNQLKNISYLNISYDGINSNLSTINFKWYFATLPMDYNNLTLMTYAHVEPWIQGNLTIRVEACKPDSVFTTSQDALLKIESTSAAHYKDKANCSCLNSTEELYTVEGTKAVGVARCGYDAQWVGCENLRCVSGKSDISNTTAVSPPSSFSRIGASVGGASLLILLVLIVVINCRRRNSNTASERVVESATTKRLPKPRSQLKIQSINTRLEEVTLKVQSIPYHTTPATSTKLGDRDYENLDNTKRSPHEASGYQPLNIHQSEAVIHTDYEVPCNGRVSLWKPHANRSTALGDNGYVEPDAIPTLQEAPGYQSLQIQKSNDVAYAEYDVTGSKRDTSDAYVNLTEPATAPGVDDYENQDDAIRPHF